MKKSYPAPRTSARKVACTVSAAALMLGVSQAATVGINFPVSYSCCVGNYVNYVNAPAFGIPQSGWESLSPTGTGYNQPGCPLYIYGQNVINTTTYAPTGAFTGQLLNPLPNGALTVSWGTPTANWSGFAGYDSGHAAQPKPSSGPPRGAAEVYAGFFRDGVNFGPRFIDDASPCAGGADNNQPGWYVDITGLKSLFTNNPFVIQLIAGSDSMRSLTNAFIYDPVLNQTQSVFYPNPQHYGDAGQAPWFRAIGGGLSTVSTALNNDHIVITGNRAQHGGDKGVGDDYDNASNISGFIVTDKPVVTMSPQPAVACTGDTVVWSGYAAGVPPLSYQWRKNGAAIPGATTTSFGLTNISSGDNAVYDLLVTNLYGTAVSAPVSPDHLSTTQGNNYVVDSNTNGPALDGLNFGATWQASVAGHSGIMSFAGTSANQIIVPGHTNLDASVGTIMFWMHSTGLIDSGGNPAMLFDRRTSSGMVIAQTKDGQIQVQTSPSIAENFLSQSVTLSDGNWHHIALVFNQADTGPVTLYIDGTSDTASANAGAWSWPAGQQIELGHSHDAFWQSYNGQMDDVRFYNRALTAGEVQTIASGGTPANNSGNVLRLNFDTAPVAGVTLRWACPGAILQSSGPVGGTYTDMPYAVSPYATSFRNASTFYRYHAEHTPSTVIANPYLM